MKRLIGLLLILSVLAVFMVEVIKDPFLTKNQLENITMINAVVWMVTSVVGGIMLVKSKPWQQEYEEDYQRYSEKCAEEASKKV